MQPMSDREGIRWQDASCRWCFGDLFGPVRFAGEGALDERVQHRCYVLGGLSVCLRGKCGLTRVFTRRSDKGGRGCSKDVGPLTFLSVLML